MAINSCARIDCEEQLCDVYIPSIGHICKDCQNKIISNFTGSYGLMGLLMIVTMFTHSSKEEGGITAEEFFKKYKT